MYNKISAFWDWLAIGILFNPLVIFSYKFWLNLCDSFCFKQKLLRWTFLQVLMKFLR